MEFRMYVVVNKDLKMSKGKTAAQVAHAVSRLQPKTEPHTVIVLQATTEQLRNLAVYLSREGIRNYTYIDEGVNEVPPYSLTVMAVAPIITTMLSHIAIFENLELFR